MRPALTVAVCMLAAGATAAGAADTTYVTLQPTTRNAGQIGRAFLLPEGTGSRIQVEVSGVPPMLSTRPVHLYTYRYAGTCDRRSKEPAFSLLTRVLAQSPSGGTNVRGPFMVSNTAPLPFDRLTAGPYAIVVRTSPADGSVDIFCGNVGR
jgi:hypothetical protein